MPSLPSEFLNSLNTIDLPNRDGFVAIHNSGEQITSIRLNPFKPCDLEFSIESSIGWTKQGFYLKERPYFTHDPLFHAGCYYVQEAGSMFLEQALLQHVDFNQNLKILDLCAAPGGKSTVLNSLMSKESVLVSNEIIASRSGILAYNLSKWGQDKYRGLQQFARAIRKTWTLF